MKHLKIIGALAVVFVFAASISASAAPNIFGVGGLIEVPDESIIPPGNIAIGFHQAIDLPSYGTTNFYTAELGLLPNLEIGGAVVDPDNRGTKVLGNGKYRIAAETVNRPSVTVGGVDLFATLNNSPGLFVVLGKNLTATAEDVIEAPSKPLRGYLGFGSGVLKGIFLGFNWTLSPKLSIQAEYLQEGLTHNEVNAQGRYAITSELRADFGTINFSDFVWGVSYSSLRF